MLVGECMLVRACLCMGVGARALVCYFALVVLLIEVATRMRHIVICSLSGSNTCLDIIINGKTFGKR
jgi:hypothetical protein